MPGDVKALTKLQLAGQAVRNLMWASSDGLPIPPKHLRRLVSGKRRHQKSIFLNMGSHCAQRVVKVLKKAQVEIDDFDAILDFGCGCGRTIRHFRTLKKATLYGTDYNPNLINWCNHNLPFAQFSTNKLHPPLSYSAESFDLIYAFSVFTHLPESLQLPWMRELSRVLKPSGYLIISTLPLTKLAEDQRTGELVVRNGSKPGTNACMVFHAFDYVKEKLASGFEIIEFVEGRDAQDVYLLRKRTDHLDRS